MASEHDIQTAILQFLKFNGIYCWRNNSGKLVTGQGRFRRMVTIGKAGLPDIIGLLKNGQFLGIEVKREGGKLTDLQRETIEELKKNGAKCFVAYSITDVQRELKI